ncbi:MAG: starch-binding protein [Paludibacteraceae bacterium]|nr:starch-binding protein [Paludibacteraceae bacterium]
MKNFTNNFKQFTSRLSARWLLMVLMLLLGTGSAWAVDIYITTTATNKINIHTWNNSCGNTSWPGQTIIESPSTNENGGFYIYTCSQDDNYNYILNNGSGGQTGDLTITSTSWGIYNGSNIFTVLMTEANMSSTSITFRSDALSGWSTNTSTTWDATKKKYKTAEVNYSKQSGIDVYIAGTKFIYKASSTFGSPSTGTYIIYWDPYTGNLTFENPCTPSATLSSAVYDAVNNEIDLSGSIAPCGKELFYGFLWKNKDDANWNTANAISGTGGSDNKTTEDIDFNQSWDGFTPGDTYEFTAYALDANTNPYTWYYSTNENDVLEVSTCTSIPDNTYAIAGNNVWTGNANPVTINYDANTYGTPTILYDGEAQIPTDVGTYPITINVPAHNGYCASTISLGDYEITCIDVEKPAITTSATVCAGTPVTLSNYNGDNANTVKWYSNSACAEVVTQQVTPTDGKEYYAKAYHEASGCYSSEYSTLTFAVNPLPTISISGSEDAVLYEDVTLTATATEGATVKWYEGGVEKGEGLTYVVTSETATSKAVTAKAFLNGCESAEVSKEVTFSAENCSTGKTKIRFRKTYNNNEYYGFNTGSVYLYSWDSETDAKYTGSYPGTLLNQTETIGDITYYVHEFTNAQSTENLTILFRAQYDYGDTLGKTYDIPLSTPGATYQIELKNGDKKKETDDKDSDNSNSIDYFEVNSTPSGGGIIITTPAVKTVSVTSDEDGNVTMVGQVVKTGCDTQAILGLQYKKQKQDGTYDDNYTTYPNSGTKEAISAGKTFTVTTKLEDGTYKVRARIDNSHTTNGYGEDIIVVVNTVKTAISEVAINYSDIEGNVIDDPNPMCKGATAYVKLSYVGSKYSDIKWLVEGVEIDNVTDEGDGVWSYIIQGTGQLSVELRNDANKDGDNPTWATSNKLSFTMKEEPTAPYISINPASGIICEGSTATIKVENPSIDCSYTLVEGDIKAGFTQYESGDLKYTVQNVGKYYVVAQHSSACPTNEYTSNQVEINQIISTSATISIEPDEEVTTTPWEPVTITVIPQEGYVYELSYTDNDLAGVAGVIIKQNGDSYTYYIPRPDSWGTGDSNPVRTAVEYGIKAQLKVDGEASQCDLNYATATIQLKDEDNENCPQ